MASALPDFSFQRLKAVKLLGSGNFGEVFLVRNAQREEFVVKRIKSCRCPQESAQVHAERNLEQLHCDHVVRLFRTWQNSEDLRVCLLMEYCNGGTLTTFVTHSFPLPERTVTALFAQLLMALDHMHLHHVLHRDLKPDNVLLHYDPALQEVSTDGSRPKVPTVKIADFGLSKSLDRTNSPAASRAGTPSYLSPELLAGHRYTRKSDVWSLGVVFYYIMTNRLPFHGNTIADLTTSVLNDVPPHPSRVVANQGMGYSAQLGDLVLRMLTKSRANRPTPREVLALPVFTTTLTEWPWKGPAFRECVGLFAKKKRAVINIRAEPSIESERIATVRYGDQIFAERGVVSTPARNVDEDGCTLWFRVVSPWKGYCVIGYGTEPLFQLLQDSSKANRLCTSSSSSSSEDGKDDSRNTSMSLSCSVDPLSISSHFTTV